MSEAFTNRLADETSPYLLQHAHNPVDWHPWGPDAIAKAKAEDKPIFLSVGYSTCYWCHVMKRESFENPTIAAEMNRRFINIKVDREERPDVDQLYMNAVQIMTRQGGWPMSVFLTPDLLPFHAGTYFPPDDRYGRPGFPRLLVAIDEAWRNRRSEVVEFAKSLAGQMERVGQAPLPRGRLAVDETLIAAVVEQSVEDYDPTFGGFGGAPKFPRETLLEMLLVRNRHQDDPKRLKQVLHTLDAMADGGIHDHLGGAFHRYSTDDRWLVPHFEIMLYDNAMLAWIYAEAFSQTGEKRYGRIARGIVDFVLREMTSREGGFYTALDAEVDAQEGLSYLWTAGQIAEVLGTDAKLFSKVYGVDRGPNFADPHHGTGQPDKNILYLPDPIDEETHARLAPMREKLYKARRQRKQPLLDTKIITSWNALMIRALAHVGRAVGDDAYLAAARNAAAFLTKGLTKGDTTLYRAIRNGKAKFPGFLDDYAFLAQALLDLGDIPAATALAKELEQRFYDSKEGGFFFTPADSTDLIFRQKVATDSPLPSGNAIAAQVFLQLDQVPIAQRTIGLYAAQTQAIGQAMSSMVQVTDEFIRRHGPFTVSAESDDRAPAKEIVTLSAQWIGPDHLRVQVTIADGFHISTNHSTGGMKGTLLSVSEKTASIEYPPGEPAAFAFADEPVRVYTGKVEIDVRFPKPTRGQPVTLALSYQACDGSRCLAPATARLEA